MLNVFSKYLPVDYVFFNAWIEYLELVIIRDLPSLQIHDLEVCCLVLSKDTVELFCGHFDFIGYKIKEDNLKTDAPY